MPMNNNLDEIGMQIDRIDNLISALSVPLPDKDHLDFLKKILPDVSGKMKRALISEAGENPWK
jgi:hypothetical protein